MNNITEYLPFLIPIVVIELGLVIAALVHCLRHKNYRIGNRTIWVIIILVLCEFVGPILYFTIGRGED